MRVKLTLILFFLISLSNISAQENLNGYKYVKIPAQFDFLKSADKYQLNSLAKFLFEKEGFSVLFDNEKLPDDLYASPCLGLNTKVLNNSGMFSTKLVIELYNCRNELVFKSTEGKSRFKEFKKAYQDALRKAFESVKEENYTFNVSLAKSTNSENFVKEKKPANAVVAVVEEHQVKENKIKEKVVSPKEKVVKVVSNEVKKMPVEIIEDNIKNVLYAQKIDNGFQLVDSTPKIVYKLLRTSKKDFYILNGKDGVAFKNGEDWFAEYYVDGKLIQKKLTIKF